MEKFQEEVMIEIHGYHVHFHCNCFRVLYKMGFEKVHGCILVGGSITLRELNFQVVFNYHENQISQSRFCGLFQYQCL